MISFMLTYHRYVNILKIIPFQEDESFYKPTYSLQTFMDRLWNESQCFPLLNSYSLSTCIQGFDFHPMTLHPTSPRNIMFKSDWHFFFSIHSHLTLLNLFAVIIGHCYLVFNTTNFWCGLSFLWQHIFTLCKIVYYKDIKMHQNYFLTLSLFTLIVSQIFWSMPNVSLTNNINKWISLLWITVLFSLSIIGHCLLKSYACLTESNAGVHSEIREKWSLAISLYVLLSFYEWIHNLSSRFN